MFHKALKTTVSMIHNTCIMLNICVMLCIILSASSSEAHDSRNHYFFLDFHELWHGHNDCLSFTEVKRRWAMLVLG